METQKKQDLIHTGRLVQNYCFEERYPNLKAVDDFHSEVLKIHEKQTKSL